MKKILVIIDAQVDFITGALGNDDIKAAYERLENYIASTDEYENVYLTRDTHNKDYAKTLEGQKLPVPHCEYASAGWQVMPRLVEAVRMNPYIKSHLFIDKPTFGSLNLPKVIDDQHFENNIEIDVVGFCTDICVASNCLLLRAHFPNTKINVLKDYCGGTTPENHEAALKVMNSCQIDII
jgi:nicotinamidase-related amidase